MNVKGEAMYSAIGSLPPKINGWRGEGVLVFEISTKRGVMKKLLRNMGVD